MPSSVIRSFVYDRAAHALDIGFVSGRRYRYLAVPPRIARALEAAPSKGGYFNRCIRNRFRFEELPAPRLAGRHAARHEADR